MEVPFFEEEIQRESMSTNGNKAPGSYGFTFKFAQFFWSELKEEVVLMFEQFYELAEFEHRFSSSFITLIPKVGYFSYLNDFRPISLLGWIHKLVTRVLGT